MKLVYGDAASDHIVRMVELERRRGVRGLLPVHLFNAVLMVIILCFISC